MANKKRVEIHAFFLWAPHSKRFAVSPPDTLPERQICAPAQQNPMKKAFLDKTHSKSYDGIEVRNMTSIHAYFDIDWDATTANLKNMLNDKVTYATLADAMYVDQRTFSNWLNGSTKLPLSNFIIFARFLNVDLLDFIVTKGQSSPLSEADLRTFICAADDSETPVMTFGPISIRPDLHRQGLGQWLLETSMEKAAAMGAGALCIEGNLDFYSKSGFVVADTRGIRYHGEPDQQIVPYFLLKELKPGFLDGISGVYHTPQGYFVDESAVAAFDRNFPPRKKLKLPGQLV